MRTSLSCLRRSHTAPAHPPSYSHPHLPHPARISLATHIGTVHEVTCDEGRTVCVARELRGEALHIVREFRRACEVLPLRLVVEHV